MLPRILEPEVMDTPEEAHDYDAMDHRAVNQRFVDDFLAALQRAGLAPEEVAAERPLRILDAGTGTAQIPIELVSRFVNVRGTWTTGEQCPLLIVAVDRAGEMLKVARHNTAAAGFESIISLELTDCKRLPFDDGCFDAVMSNSIVHHIPEPKTVLAEMGRVLRPGGVLFVRDLLRPGDSATLEQLVQTYAGGENTHQQQMFRDSLQAALTLDELRHCLRELNLPGDVEATSDRHWTWTAQMPLPS